MVVEVLRSRIRSAITIKIKLAWGTCTTDPRRGMDVDLGLIVKRLTVREVFFLFVLYLITIYNHQTFF